ncbi:hypothetical protein LH935_14880 [Gordonia polyisoprenivorans]|uniref:hypothetical protein n=1 Tax=Gordonia polyisoprenivorans TaxID=84595 RepID=UPI00223439E4|nr:hypothetical protein LH935_14880 [Gordonia polyisoprenivorans]
MSAKENPAVPGGVPDETAVSAASTAQSTGPRSGYVNLVPAHIDELVASAIAPAVAARHGVYSATDRDGLPEWAQWLHDKHGDGIYPVLVYPMTEPDGSLTGQVRPAGGSVTDADGNEMKYVSPAGDKSPQLPVVREVDDPVGVLVVEGVKQALAADTWAPSGWVIYRICGITGWVRNGVPTKHLRVVRDLDVVVIPDADAATKRAVYDGAVTLGEACEARRATSAKFARVAGFGNTGVDDVLGACADDDERRELFADLLAATTAKPAKSAPKAPTAAQRRAKNADRAATRLAAERRSDARPVIHVGEDRAAVIDELDRVLRARFDGEQLFRHGDALGRLVVEAKGPAVSRVTEGAFADLVSQAAITVAGAVRDHDSKKGCEHDNAWPDKNSIAAIESRFRNYKPLDGASAVPLVREDGSIVTESGYDEETRHYVHLSEDLIGLSVPEHPTEADIAAARALLVEGLLGDFLLKDRSDVAHAVSALITPLVRPLLPTSPGFVVNGLQAGVGKGLLLNVMSTIVAGQNPSLSMLPKTEDDMRKSLTAILYSGATAIFFDETAEIDSAVLNGFITAESWSDRRLGVTERIEMPNRSTIVFAGNQVVVIGDAARRMVQIRLHTDEPNPESRTGFRHGDLKGWVVESRRELLRACLVLIAAWFDKGQPVPDHPARMGSFERWQDMMGGILMVAGIDGLLDGWFEQRAASDIEGQHWSAHLQWLADHYGDDEFTARTAANDLKYDDEAEYPPGLEDLGEKASAARELGKAWSKQADRWRANGLRIVQIAAGAGGRMKWRVQRYDEATGGPVSVIADSAAATPPAPAPSIPAEPGRPMPVITDLDEGVS